MSVLIFDIETIPDVRTGEKLYDLQGLSDEDIGKAMFALRKKKVGHTFLPHHLQKIVAISLVMQTHESVKVWSLGAPEDDEPELIARFFKGLEQHTPNLVSWNGSGFDLPVLHYRALHHGIQATRYWEMGEQASQFKWNNYINRFHMRHLDLMDVLASYQNKAFAPLDEVACMLGFPGKMGMSGAHVFDAYQEKKIQKIRDYCETDVLNTYCVYLKFELMRGNYSESEYVARLEQLREMLAAEGKPHLTGFLEAMQD